MVTRCGEICEQSIICHGKNATDDKSPVDPYSARPISQVFVGELRQALHDSVQTTWPWHRIDQWISVEETQQQDAWNYQAGLSLFT